MGTALLYTFPFLIYVDSQSPIKVKEIIIDDTTIRIYPFFRSGKANFIPMPPISVESIPFIEGLNIEPNNNLIIPTLAAIPSLEKDVNGESIMHLFVKEEFEQFPSIMPMDSLRIDLLSREENKDQIVHSSVSKLIQLIRHKTKQWWMEHHTTASLLRANFAILKNGFPLEKPWSNAMGRTVTGDEIPIDEAIWEESINDLEQEKVSPLYALLNLDARYFAAISDFRRAVLDAVIACEQARDIHFERLWFLKAGDVPFKINRVLSGVNLPVHLSADLLKMTNNTHSFEIEHPNDFAVIEDLWDARGNIAHGRPNQYRRDGVLNDVNEDKITEFIKSTSRCIKWLESI